MQGAAAVIRQGEVLPPFDLHIPMMSLPLAFGTQWDSIPAPPYLAAPPEDVAHWRDKLGPRTRPRIGLCWSGAPAQAADRWRSIPLDALKPLAELNADLYALQPEVRERDRDAFAALGLIPLKTPDYASTAGLIETLDLVITVCTSVANLTGALGRKGLVLLGAVPDHRWGWDEDVSPWYPTLTLLRQERVGDWSGVVERARAEVEKAGERA